MIYTLFYGFYCHRYSYETIMASLANETGLSQKDRERAVYGLQEKNLAKIYIKLIPLGMRDPDAVRLLNWKRPTEREVWCFHWRSDSNFSISS